MKLNDNMQKLCCFYASDWHLTVMLLPYINKKLNENCKIYFKSEFNIDDKINILLNKLQLRNSDKIRNINNRNIVEEDDELTEKIFIFSGKDEFIKEKNNLVENFYRNKNCKVKIINCYEFKEENDIQDIIIKNNYTVKLNTKGETNI